MLSSYDYQLDLAVLTNILVPTACVFPRSSLRRPVATVTLLNKHPPISATHTTSCKSKYIGNYPL